ncbi:hypothetical protein GALMADRAFT_1053073 [Galerina marginata CBS 339.88]|uniref:Uncharacterized protein n=1 Tax=Galerina marginata (strain CBS 339.88) TaxID=685588 RepID=A0A067SAH8_GALM3|nr:hypothetical protein GALMADRAFT_1053073 [Galerina marginata CBS 339.88]
MQLLTCFFLLWPLVTVYYPLGSSVSLLGGWKHYKFPIKSVLLAEKPETQDNLLITYSDATAIVQVYLSGDFLSMNHLNCQLDLNLKAFCIESFLKSESDYLKMSNTGLNSNCQQNHALGGTFWDSGSRSDTDFQDFKGKFIKLISSIFNIFE